MAADYKNSHTQPLKGRSYHASFTNIPYRSMVWKQEQILLKGILKKYFENQQIVLLDFACGTGRILSYLENHTTHAVGVDLSPSMLKVALENNKQAEIIEADLTKKDVLGNRKFNLVTAFRFFPNAQPELRKEVMELLCMHLESSGYIVFNNHKNSDSSINRLYRFFNRGKIGYNGMSMREVRELVAECKLEIVEVFHLCVFPVSERKTLLPIFLLSPIERLLSRLRFLQNLGMNLIFVCRHSKCPS